MGARTHNRLWVAGALQAALQVRAMGRSRAGEQGGIPDAALAARLRRPTTGPRTDDGAAGRASRVGEPAWSDARIRSRRVDPFRVTRRRSGSWAVLSAEIDHQNRGFGAGTPLDCSTTPKSTAARLRKRRQRPPES